MDLRSIPIIVGGLYLRPLAGAILLIISVLYRFILFGFGVGFLTSILVSVVTVIALIFVQVKFRTGTTKAKLRSEIH